VYLSFAMRRLFSLLFIVATLHLLLAGSDPACASHGEHDGGTMAGMAMPGTPQPASHDTAPVPTRCCEALSSCSLVAAVSTSERPAARAGSIAPTPSDAPSVLASVSTAPEPPPPKA
jgi:hypothetical protein